MSNACDQLVDQPDIASRALATATIDDICREQLYQSITAPLEQYVPMIHAYMPKGMYHAGNMHSTGLMVELVITYICHDLATCERSPVSGKDLVLINLPILYPGTSQFEVLT